ncbi:STT3 domain-containing protein [Campylobacter concisus]|uniref:General glycosylation pathway protein n=1 Tax=Campylobacter concisus TaxID=199 RepID=A0A1Y5MMC5_9BACT|nr:STT3 domain-containing protein [Campylobacter concisus]OUT08484.1 general glycosylation pathway protein [Campylobacter concisus]
MNRNLFFKNYSLYLMIFAAVIFGMVCRLYWVFWASEYPVFFWNNELMISTNDGYAFAEGARDMLAGFHQENDLSYYGYPLSTLTYWIVKFLGVKLETAMIYMSVFFSSLVAVPVILIANEYKLKMAGFIAALLAVIANSYYNRTMAGYYDTDMLIITLSVFVVWGLVRVLEKKDAKSLIIAPLSVLIYMWWYMSAFSLISILTGLFLLYTLIFDRKNPLFYLEISLLLLAISNLDITLKFIAVIVIYALCLFKKEVINLKIALGILAVIFVVFVVRGGLNPIIFQLKFYVFRDAPEVGGMSFHFFNVNQTIQESSVVDFTLFCERISANVITFLISLAGVALFCYRHRSFAVSLGMLALGFLAFKSGLRFTIYAVPIMALGFGYLVEFVLANLKLKEAVLNLIRAFIAALVLAPALIHIYGYKAEPVFVHKEVEILNKLKGIAGREDYVLAWWDYGYPIRYYSDVKTLIDGGKHLGRENFAVSFALGSDEMSSANMARLDVEYTERNFKERFNGNLAQILKDRNLSVDQFFSEIKEANFSLPAKSREIYYYLPDRMLSIFPTILQFSKIDLKSGKNLNNGLFVTTRAISQSEKGIRLSGGFTLTSDVTSLIYDGKVLPLRSFIETDYNEAGKLNVKEYKNNEMSNISVIYMRDYGRFIILDESILNSSYIQLFVLERYDPKVFEPVILDGAAKVYKLKR